MEKLQMKFRWNKPESSKENVKEIVPLYDLFEFFCKFTFKRSYNGIHI